MRIFIFSSVYNGEGVIEQVKDEYITDPCTSLSLAMKECVFHIVYILRSLKFRGDHVALMICSSVKH
jgi:hypothetical protein